MTNLFRKRPQRAILKSRDLWPLSLRQWLHFWQLKTTNSTFRVTLAMFLKPPPICEMPSTWVLGHTPSSCQAAEDIIIWLWSYDYCRYYYYYAYYKTHDDSLLSSWLQSLIIEIIAITIIIIGMIATKGNAPGNNSVKENLENGKDILEKYS